MDPCELRRKIALELAQQLETLAARETAKLNADLTMDLPEKRRAIITMLDEAARLRAQSAYEAPYGIRYTSVPGQAVDSSDPRLMPLPHEQRKV